MVEVIDAFRAFSALNVALLVGLGYIWGRNYVQFRSKHTLGLFVFAVLLLLENLLAVYFFVFHATLTAWILDPQAVPPIAQFAMSSLRALEFAGLVFLSWISWD